jgi:hypothetical protein
MNPEMQNSSDRAVPAVANGRLGPALDRQGRSSPLPGTRHEVMNTLLGENDLAAFDAFGGDPYNATGRHVRR